MGNAGRPGRRGAGGAGAPGARGRGGAGTPRRGGAGRGGAGAPGARGRGDAGQGPETGSAPGTWGCRGRNDGMGGADQVSSVVPALSGSGVGVAVVGGRGSDARLEATRTSSSEG